MKRTIIKIDEDKCDGCGACAIECHEGAIKIVNGKAKLYGEMLCDGLGACLANCPLDAISIEEREAEEYDEEKVLDLLLNGSYRKVDEHLKHLVSSGESGLLEQAVRYLNDHEYDSPYFLELSKNNGNKKPESKSFQMPEMPVIATINSFDEPAQDNGEFRLNQWPVQLHLVQPDSEFFKSKEIVLMSTCGPVASPELFKETVRSRALVIACPKLDNTAPYAQKLSSIIQKSMTSKVVVFIMEVPCCIGLTRIAKEAMALSGRHDVAIEVITVRTNGKYLNSKII